jgi:hypothetical protein
MTLTQHLPRLLTTVVFASIGAAYSYFVAASTPGHFDALIFQAGAVGMGMVTGGMGYVFAYHLRRPIQSLG